MDQRADRTSIGTQQQLWWGSQREDPR